MPATMRLLLLLSALLSALTGVVGTRATAQPVQASAAAILAPARIAAAAPMAARFAAPAYGSIPPLRLIAPRVFGVVARQPLYAERRRE